MPESEACTNEVRTAALDSGAESIEPSLIGARLDRMPTTQFHHHLLWVIGAGLFVDGFDVYLSAGVSGALVKQGFASLAQVAALAFATAVGLATGGIVSGILADRIGRRPTMRWTILVVSIGSLCAAISPTIPLLVASRLVTALGLGGEAVLGYAVLGEFLPPDSRGRWLARLALFANITMPTTLFIGYRILPMAGGWRWMLVIPGIAAAAVFFLRRSLCESPRWLARRGRFVEAGLIVRRIESSAPQPLPAVVNPPAVAMAPATSNALAALFTPGVRQRMLVGATIHIAIVSAIFGFVSWLPTFFAKEGNDIATSTLFAAVISTGSPIGGLIGMWTSDRYERKWGIVVGSAIAALLGACYAMAGSSTAILVSGLLVVTAIYATGTLSLAYIPELFPTATRIRGVGFSTAAGRLVAMILPFAIVPVFATTGQAGVISLISLILVVQAVIVAVFGIRARGRSLEALETGLQA